MAVRPRKPDGKFDKGQPVPTVRRRKGSPNKITRDVKEWFLRAADAIGQDGKGQNGGQGFVEAVSREKKEALFAALARFVPPPKDGEPGSAPAGPLEVNIIAVPCDQYLTREEARRAAGLPPGEAPRPPIDHSAELLPVLEGDDTNIVKLRPYGADDREP